MANIRRRNFPNPGSSDLEDEPQRLGNPYHPFVCLSPESSTGHLFNRFSPLARRSHLCNHEVDEELGSDPESVVSDPNLSDPLDQEARAAISMELFSRASPTSDAFSPRPFSEGTFPNSDPDGCSELDFDLLEGEATNLELGLQHPEFLTSRLNEDEDALVDDDEYFIQQRFNFFDAESGISSVPPYPIVRDVDFESDSYEGSGLGEWPIIPDSDNLGIDVQYYDDCSQESSYNDDVSVEIPLRWDSLRLEDHGVDYGWEEVADDRDVLSVFVGEGEVDEEVEVRGDLLSVEEEAASLSSISPVLVVEDLVSGDDSGVGAVAGNDSMEVALMGNIDWEVFLTASNLVPGAEYELNDFVYHQNEFASPAEYLDQILESETIVIESRPAASKHAIENLASVVVTKEIAEEEKSLCAVCKDEIAIGEQAKKLPCSHQYHGECIIPWLNIRNTCPVCRYELPTDDPDYERGRAARQRVAR